MVNGSFRGPKERRSFKPKVAGSTPVGRIPCCSALYRVLECDRSELGLYVESAEPLSPKELADYTKSRLDHVACHIRVLAERRAVELVEVRPARGAVEHFYTATGLVDEVPWARTVLGLKETS